MARRNVITQGWPVSLEMGAVLPGPANVVWHLITDWENQGDWMLEASDFVITSEHREGLGVEGEATVKIGGIKTRDRIVVTAWEPERRLGISHEGWVSGGGEILLTPLADGRTHVFWREDLYPPLGVLGAIGISVFRPLMQRIFERDLEALTALVRAAVNAPAPR